MADYTITTRTVWPTANDVAATAGEGKKFLEKKAAPALHVPVNGNFVLSGLAIPASSANLNISMPVGEAWISGYHVVVSSATSVMFTASATNYVFLKLLRDGLNNVTDAKFEVNTTGTTPTDGLLLASGVASGAAITSTQDLRRRGPVLFPAMPWRTGVGSTLAHEGAVTIGANQNLSGVHFYSDFTINAGVIVTVPPGAGRLVIIATGTITINGTINAAGGGLFAGGGGGAAAGGDGANGTDQAGGGGGGGNGAGLSKGGTGGSVVAHGLVIQSGSAGGPSNTNTPADPATQLTGSSAPIADPVHVWGAASGGGGGGDGTLIGAAGGRGGASIVLIAPTVIVASGATLNTSGVNGTSAGSANTGGGGGGGGGNILIVTRSYTDSGATFTQAGGTGGSPNGFAGAGGAGAAGIKEILYL